VEGKSHKDQSFKQYMQNAEKHSDARAAVENAREELCHGSPCLLTEAEFNKKFADYVKRNPDGNVAAAYGERQPEPLPTRTPAPAIPSKEERNAQIVERAVEPLRKKREVARNEVRNAEVRLKECPSGDEAQKKWEAAKEREKESAVALESAQKALQRAKALEKSPRNPNVIVMGQSVATAQKALNDAKTNLERSKRDTIVRQAELDRRKRWV